MKILPAKNIAWKHLLYLYLIYFIQHFLSKWFLIYFPFLISLFLISVFQYEFFVLFIHEEILAKRLFLFLTGCCYMANMDAFILFLMVINLESHRLFGSHNYLSLANFWLYSSSQ